MSEKLTCVLVGCGRISTRHIEVLADHPGIQLVGVCDSREDRLAKAATASGAPAFTDYLEMVRTVRPDIVSVLTHSGAHARVACDVVPYTGNVVVEKPMALTLDDADRMIDTCDRAGVGLFVVQQNRYNRPVVKLRQALDRGRFGKLSLGTVRVRWCRTQEYYDLDAWRGTWRDDGGVFANQASHHVDLLQWLMGPVESVQAYTATRLVDVEVEDVGLAILKFRSGALGVAEATTTARPRDLEGSVSVLGERGSAVIGGFAVNRVETWNFAEASADDVNPEEWSQNPPTVYGFGHMAFYNDVLDCIRTRRRAMLDGIEGRKSLELVIAIYQAAATRKEVRLRYVPEGVPLGLDLKDR
ncbi:oxidoreductase [Luteitalea sp. TBR-22]|uniref:Gfo/Idh/MocA family protein n=1 Tax=Luteitalea sp. TBR-22 TaxID=2802971 RepID=UPI001AF8A9C5|nr:Gfo/Idh/MocA family oxidoreductase [Luteitalea sp. TBR-22]BCS36060.1 oxidoreductase [Luteitalea sp. TBR-22]